MLLHKFRSHNLRLQQELLKKRGENDDAEASSAAEIAQKIAEIRDPLLREYVESKLSPKLKHFVINRPAAPGKPDTPSP